MTGVSGSRHSVGCRRWASVARALAPSPGVLAFSPLSPSCQVHQIKDECSNKEQTNRPFSATWIRDRLGDDRCARFSSAMGERCSRSRLASWPFSPVFVQCGALERSTLDVRALALALAFDRLTTCLWPWLGPWRKGRRVVRKKK